MVIFCFFFILIREKSCEWIFKIYIFIEFVIVNVVFNIVFKVILFLDGN